MSPGGSEQARPEQARPEQAQAGRPRPDRTGPDDGRATGTSTEPGVDADLPTLADTAARYTAAKWPILPVQLPVRENTGAVSTRDLVVTRPPGDERVAREWWSDRPYGIAAAVGVHFDVLVVPARIGPAVAAQFPPVTQAAISHPNGSWLFLVSPGSPVIQDMPRRCGVTLHRAGDHILLPPTPVPDGELDWEFTPCDLVTPAGPRGRRCQIRVPHSLVAQHAVVKVLNLERSSVPFPRQGNRSA
jgi:hypothetical protein